MFLLRKELLILLILSVPFAILDIRDRKVDGRLFLFLFFLSLIWIAVSGRKITDYLLSAGVGAVLFLIAVITRERIGKGDALFFISAAGFLTAGQSLALFCISFILSAVIALFKIVAGKYTPLPFLALIPFSLVLMMGA